MKTLLSLPLPPVPPGTCHQDCRQDQNPIPETKVESFCKRCAQFDPQAFTDSDDTALLALPKKPFFIFFIVFFPWKLLNTSNAWLRRASKRTGWYLSTRNFFSAELSSPSNFERERKKDLSSFFSSFSFLQSLERLTVRSPRTDCNKKQLGGTKKDSAVNLHY